MPRTRPRLRSLLLAPALIALLAACSGATAAPSGVATIEGATGTDARADANGSPAASIDPQDALLEFTRCMREHGIDMPDPQVAGAGGGGAVRVDLGEFDSSEFQAAQEACQDILGQAGFGPGASMSPEDLDAIVEFAECMREHGIDMPDPQTNGGGIMIGGDGGIDPSSPEFRAAQEACGDRLPGRFGPGGPATDEQAAGG